MRLKKKKKFKFQINIAIKKDNKIQINLTNVVIKKKATSYKVQNSGNKKWVIGYKFQVTQPYKYEQSDIQS